MYQFQSLELSLVIDVIRQRMRAKVCVPADGVAGKADELLELLPQKRLVRPGWYAILVRPELSGKAEAWFNRPMPILMLLSQR
jgi:hypothetical protein